MYILSDESLNQEQKAAIYTNDNVLLIACPGSGKTRTLIYKIAYELSKMTSSKQFVIAIRSLAKVIIASLSGLRVQQLS